MKSEAHFLPVPPEFLEYRDRLRVVGYELVRYSKAHAQSEAAQFRHSPADYEYAIHKIESIQAENGQIYIKENAFYSSASRVPDWTKYFVDQEKPVGIGLLGRFFKDPVNALLTLAVPPYGLTLLGLTAVGDRINRKEQQNRRESLPHLSEIPKFLPR
jgi:hypothetical protein